MLRSIFWFLIFHT